jgi:uncharacterized protein (TIGR02449 family)
MIMDELLQRLEKKIKDLIDQHDRLITSNQQLNSGKNSLVREKDLLLARQEKAINQIKTLVARLKAIENST